MTTREPRRAPSWDPIVTVMLLVFGLYNVTTEVAQARDLKATMFDPLYASAGLGTYSNAQLATVDGLIISAVSVLCLVLAIGFAVPRIRTKRVAFWIPLVCALISIAVSLVLVLAPLLSDPVFVSRLMRAT